MATEDQKSAADNELTPQETSWGSYVRLLLASGIVGLIASALVWVFHTSIQYLAGLTYARPAGSMPDYWRWFLVILPVLGGLMVALILRNLSNDKPKADMAQLIDSMAEHGGHLEYRNGIVYILASFVGISFGAPVGEDTPSAMIGGHLAGYIGDRIHQPRQVQRALVIAGVAAGIASTYFAQLAAVFFALEIVLGGFGGGFFVVPALIGVAMSALFTFLVGGAPPPFASSVVLVRWDYSLLLYLLVALLAALAAVIYVRLLPYCQNLWERIVLPFWARPALAGLLVGIVSLWVPDIFGTGLVQMQQIFAGGTYAIGALLVLAAAKIVLTPSSLGSGFAGGVVGPALLIGSSLGLAFGQLAAIIFPGLAISPLAFAFVGSAAMLSAAFHAPLFAAMLVLEMTADYRFLVPVLLGAAISFALARAFLPGSAYTFELQQRGIYLEQRTVIDVEKKDKPN